MSATEHPDTSTDAAAFALALASARMVAWERDLDGAAELRFVGNPAAVFGEPVDGAAEAVLLERLHPEDHDRVHATIAAAVAASAPFHLDFLARWGDGSLHRLLMDGRVLTDARGRRRVVGITRNGDAERAADDVTRRAEDADARLDAFFGAAPIGMALMDAELRYLRVNDILAVAHGVPAAGHVGRRPLEVLTPTVGALVDATARRALASGEPVVEVALVGDHEDEARAWALDFFPALTATGTRVGVGMIARDVTDRVRAARERRVLARRTETLARASALLETSLDYDQTLARLADMMVQYVATGCAVDLLVDGVLARAVVRHRGGPGAQEPATAAEEALRGRVAETQTAERLPPGEAGQRPAVAVPLTARGRTLGVLTLVGEHGEPFGEDDVTLAVELGRRAALAVHNARLYRAATTEQREAEDARAALDLYLERAPVGFALLDADGRFVRANAALAAITGLPAAAHVGTRPGELLGHVGDEIEIAVREVLADGESITDRELAGALPAVPGRERRFLVSVYRVRLGGEGGAGVGAIVVETTDRLRAEQALRGQRDLYETLLLAQSEMGEAFLLLEGQQAIYVNEATERMTQRTAQELYDLPTVLALFPPELHAALVRRIREILLGLRDAQGFETELLTAGGDRLSVEVSAQPLESDGRRRVVVVARDVSERRRQEREREELLAAEQRARRETEVAHGRADALAALSEAMDGSMDLRRTLPEALDVVLGHGANIASIHVLERGGERLVRMGIGADTPERDAGLGLLLATEYPLGSASPLAGVARTGEPLYTGALMRDVLAGIATTPLELEVLERFAPASIAVLPMVARGRTLGVIALGWDQRGRHFSPIERQHLEEVARRLATGIDNAQLYGERAHIASTLQASLLPPELPDIPGVEAAARYLPAGEASEVGGDFYDLYATDAGRWAVVVGDVCGKGAEAAAVTAMARYTLRAATIADPAGPGRSFGLLNTAMTAERVAERFLTAVLGELHLADGHAELVMACAGHPAPLVVRADGRVEAVPAFGALLGVADFLTWEDTTVRLGPGDAIVLYTDGVTEADRRRPMSPEDLAAELRAAVPPDMPLAPSAEVLADAVRAVAERRADGPLRDDVAIVALRLDS